MTVSLQMRGLLSCSREFPRRHSDLRNLRWRPPLGALIRRTELPHIEHLIVVHLLAAGRQPKPVGDNLDILPDQSMIAGLGSAARICADAQPPLKTTHNTAAPMLRILLVPLIKATPAAYSCFRNSRDGAVGLLTKAAALS